MRNYNNYPVQYDQVRHSPVSSIVYVPQIGNKKINRSVSVVALIMIIALLFVGMKVMNGEGVINEKLVWVSGYIDAKGEAHSVDIDANGWQKFTSWAFKKDLPSASGMFTKNAIPIKTGVRISMAYETNYYCDILAYDSNDAFIGTFTRAEGNLMTLTKDDFTGEDFGKTEYIRLFIYPKNNTSESQPTPFTFKGMKRAKEDFKVTTLVLNNK